MALPDQYRKAYADKAALKAKGDPAYKALAQDVRKMERELAREGTIAEGGKIIRTDAPTKVELQKDYIRKFEAPGGGKPKQVRIVDAVHPEGVVTSLADFHRKRLLGR